MPKWNKREPLASLSADELIEWQSIAVEMDLLESPAVSVDPLWATRQIERWQAFWGNLYAEYGLDPAVEHEINRWTGHIFEREES